jgi:hypothetical protein
MVQGQRFQGKAHFPGRGPHEGGLGSFGLFSFDCRLPLRLAVIAARFITDLNIP